MFKFFIAFVAGRLACFALRIIGRKASQFPGRLALKICPDFCAHIGKPETIICVTGTNGKTTVCNLTEDILRKCGYSFCDNSFGSNTVSGVATALMKGVTLLNKPKTKLGVFEVDERSTLKIFCHVKPDYLLVTNLFRDSVRRNAHTEFIASILSCAIPEGVKLILNADDLISSRLCSGKDNARVYFGVAPLPGEITDEENIINDLRYCPLCGSRLEYTFRRYHHIGRAHCPSCSFESFGADYLCTGSDDNVLTLEKGGEKYCFPLVNSSITNIYNETAAIALLTEFGIPCEKTAAALTGTEITESRYSSQVIGGINVIRYMLKGQNPIAASRACSFAGNYKGEKNILFMLDDFYDRKETTENMLWIYESDFELLANDSVHHIFVTGDRAYDIIYRLLFAGVKEDNIVYFPDYEALKSLDLFADCDTFIIMHELFMFNDSETVKKIVTDKLTNG